MQNYSYVTILTNFDFFPGLCALSYSLKKVKSKYPLTVIVPETASDELLTRIRKLGLPIQKAPAVILPEPIQAANPYSRWNDTFFKLAVFNLTQFDKIVFLDLDMIVVRNIDDLFQKPHMSAVAAGRCAHASWTRLNSGLMVIAPNSTVYSEMLECITPACQERLQQGLGFGDQDVINYYYSDWWHHQDLVLPEVYNAVTFSFDAVCKTFGYKNLKVIHYAEPPKLWQKPAWRVYAHIVKCILNGEWARARMCGKYMYYLLRSRS